MSSFRDRFNPEAVHFPSRIRSKILIVLGSGLALLCLIPSYIVEQPPVSVAIDTVLVAAVVAFLVLSWPQNLMTDQFGITAKSPPPFGRMFVPWKDVASVEEKKEFHGWLEKWGIECDALAVYSSNGKQVIHRPLHGDRARFIHELEIHGVSVRRGDQADSEQE